MYRNSLEDKRLWNAIFSVLSVVLCSCCLIGCVFVAQRARQSSVPQAAQIRSITSRQASLAESLEAMQLELERLSNRVKMQRVRNATEHGLPRAGNGSMPDPHSQPAEWRAAMNRKLAEAKTGVKL